MDEYRPGRYRHYKGNDYELLNTARHSETLAPMVVYRALYGEGGVWVRPAEMWHEPVPVVGASVPRFTYTGPMDVLLRHEEPGDWRAVENLTREAFWNLMAPGCVEHYLLHVMRGDPSFIPELDFVAVKDGRLVGNIVYTKSCVLDTAGKGHEAITFGPVSVHPDYQKSGIGTRLILHTLGLAKKMGYPAVIILGHPDYYPRFGFRRAREFGLTFNDGDTRDAFMALELAPGSLAGLAGGVFHESDVFNVKPKAAELFDQNFPPKEKKVTDTQL